MARGWESKDVESRAEAAAAAASAKRELEPRLTTEEQARMDRRHQIEMARARVLGELQRTCHPRFRGQLEGELAHLDAELKKLDA